VIRATFAASALLLAGTAWLHRTERAGWQAGAEHICKQVAAGKPSRVVDRVCQIEIAGVWHKPPPVVRGGGQ